MKCPKCQNIQGYKQKIDFINYYFCPCCLFKCYLKHYQGQLRKIMTNKQQKLYNELTRELGSSQIDLLDELLNDLKQGIVKLEKEKEKKEKLGGIDTYEYPEYYKGYFDAVNEIKKLI